MIESSKLKSVTKRPTHRGGESVLEYDWESSVGYWVCTTSHSLRRALSVRLAEEDMTLRQWEVLASLSVHGSVSQTRLAECLGLEPHTIVGILNRMVRDGWLERRCCEEDRRRNLVHPTPKAEAVWSRLTEICHEVRYQAVAGLSDAELSEFQRICERIRANLAGADESSEADDGSASESEVAGSVAPAASA